MAKEKCREQKGGKSVAVSKLVNVEAVDESIRYSLQQDSLLQDTYSIFEEIAEELQKVDGSSFKKYSM